MEGLQPLACPFYRGKKGREGLRVTDIFTEFGKIVQETKTVTVFAADGKEFLSEAEARKHLRKQALRDTREFARYIVGADEIPEALMQQILNVAQAIQAQGVNWAAQAANLPQKEK